jgi:hypothetical protein
MKKVITILTVLAIVTMHSCSQGELRGSRAPLSSGLFSKAKQTIDMESADLAADESVFQLDKQQADNVEIIDRKNN